MYISEICIKRPVLATVLNLIIIVMGLVAFFKLPVRGSPDIDPPIITISTFFPGANSEFIEKNITKIIESAIKNVKNLDHLSSTSSTGRSEITAVFKLTGDIEVALNDIRSKVSEIQAYLPADTHAPQVSKMDNNAWPSMWICANGDKYDTMTLTDIITQRIKPELEKLNSVSVAQIHSNGTYAIQINLDPVKLYQNKITPQEIRSQIAAQSKDYPAGQIQTEVRDFTINLQGTLNTTEEFENIIISNIGSNIIKLKDIANVELKPLVMNSNMRYNGAETIAIAIVKQSKANVIEFSQEILNKLPLIEKSLPDGIKLHIAYDAAIPVKASINSVYITALEALILVMIIVYLFLGSLKITIVPFIAIPVSIIGTFAVMQALSFTINLYSLLAMIMAIGLVVDDAIVMLENIYRHYEEGTPAQEAAFKASKEIGFAIVAMTITLAAVFLPIGFIEGFVGKLFIEFAWTLATCVIISGFVAITLSPMLSAKILAGKQESAPPRFVQIFNGKLIELTGLYEKKLIWVLSDLKKTAIIGVASIAILIFSFYFVKKEFMPQEDDAFLLISGNGADGATLNSTIDAIKQAEQVVRNVKEVKGYFFNIHGNEAFGFIPLKSWEDRNKSQQEIVNLINPKLSLIPSMTLFAMSPGGMGGDFGQAVSISLQSFGDFKDLDSLSLKFLKELKTNKVFQNPDRDLRTSIPTIEIEVDRDIASKHNIYIDQIGLTLQYLIAGVKVAEFNIGNEKYDVTMGFAADEKNKISDLSKIYVKSRDGEMVHLSNLAKINENISVLAYNHYNIARSVKISADLAEGYTIANAKEEIEKIAYKLIDKAKINLEFLGEIKRMSESNSNMLFTFCLALIFIYLVLAAQFESFLDPFIIMLAVPFSITGGVLALLVCGSSINLYSNIGIITLIGLITKNSIMIVEFANQLKAQGQSKLNAITNACVIRLRPILMTSFATIFGSLPLVFASGAAAGSRQSIGLVIVGGMLIGTFFTLFIIPSIYYKLKK